MDANHTVLQMLEARRDKLKEEQASNATAIEAQIKKILMENFGPKYVKSDFNYRYSLIIVLGTVTFQVYRIHSQWTAEVITHEVHSVEDPDCVTAVNKLLSAIKLRYPDLTKALDLLINDSKRNTQLVTGSMLQEPK